MRIVIAGHPRTGKTTLAKAFSCEHTRCTDELIETHKWSEQSDAVSYWFDCADPYVLEGCAIPRAMRKWRQRHPDDYPPFDLFIYIESLVLTPMAKGIETIMVPLWDWLDDSPVMILRGTAVL